MNTQTKVCVHCKSEINKDASRCPKCGGKNYVWTTGKKVFVGVFVVIISFWIIGSIGSSGSSNSGSDNSSSSTSNTRKITSTAFAEDIIKRILKAPSTAKFVDVQAYELSNEKDVWAVNGYVDSQNSFGAMIRSSWEVQLDYRDGKGGTVKSVMFDGKKYQ